MRYLLFAVFLALTGPAWSHAILMESRPGLRTTLKPGPTPIVLRYNSRIDRARSRLLLVQGDAKPVVLPLADSGPDILETTADLQPGAYVLRWQVLAIDGHITRGDVPFTVVP